MGMHGAYSTRLSLFRRRKSITRARSCCEEVDGSRPILNALVACMKELKRHCPSPATVMSFAFEQALMLGIAAAALAVNMGAVGTIEGEAPVDLQFHLPSTGFQAGRGGRADCC